MSGSSQTNAAERFKLLIKETRKLRRELSSESGLSPGQSLLSTWQCERLAQTYADYRQHKRYRLALEFFLTDLYGPSDFSQRDSDIARVYPIMVKMLSATAIDSLAKAMHLNALSMSLDQRLLDVLVSQFGLDPNGSPDKITPDSYAEAYRICDNYDERVKQIDLAIVAAQTLDDAVKKKIIYMTVKVARRPARVAGFGELQSFIERGLTAFKKMKGSTEFLAALRSRETHILDKIYAAAPAEEWYGDVVNQIIPP